MAIARAPRGWRTITRLTAIVAVLLVGILQQLPAPAISGNYEIADDTQHGLSCDSSGTRTNCTDPSGTAGASYELQVDRTGKMVAGVGVASDAPIGWVQGPGVGGARAFSYPNIQQYFYSVPAGSHRIRATIDVTSLQISSPNGFNTFPGNALYQGGSAYLRTSVLAYVYPCDPSQACGPQNQSVPDFGGATYPYAYDASFLTNTGESDGIYQAGVFTVDAPFELSQPGYIWAIVYFAAVGQAIGPDASASARATAVLTNLVVQ